MGACVLRLSLGQTRQWPGLFLCTNGLTARCRFRPAGFVALFLFLLRLWVWERHRKTLFKHQFEKGFGDWGMTRPSDVTRERILKAAQRLFADHGYQDTSVRAVVARARVNQAAINYHFGGKDGLYREVLRATIRALTEQQLAHAEETKEMPRENALAEFIKYQLRPLAARDELSRHFRIFNWEAVVPRPSTEN